MQCLSGVNFDSVLYSEVVAVIVIVYRQLLNTNLWYILWSLCVYLFYNETCTI